MTKPNLANNTSSKKNEPSKNIIISSKDVVVLKTNTGNKTPVSKKQEKKKVFFNFKKEEVQWTPKKEKGNKSVLTTKATIKQVISKTNVKNKHASISQLPIEKNKQTNSLSSRNKNNLFNHIRSEKKKALNPLSSLIPEKQTITEIINKQEAKRTLSFAKTLIASLNQATKRKSHTTGYYASLEKEKQLQEQEKQKKKPIRNSKQSKIMLKNTTLILEK